MKNKEKKKKRNKKKNKKKKVEKLNREGLFHAIIKHMPIYITILISCYLINKQLGANLFLTIFSLLSVMYSGYNTHILSHKLNFTKIYKKHNHFTKQYKFIDKICKSVCSFFDFHKDVHHDSKINKLPINVFYECLHNLFFQGLGMLLFCHIVARLNPWMFIFWALLYSSLHHINMNIFGSLPHAQHHVDPTTNYGFGFDLYDIMFDTIDGINETETFYSAIINVAVITGVLYYIIPYFKK